MPVQALRIPESWAFKFHDNRHMKVERLSALRTGRLYPAAPKKYSSHSFPLEAKSTPGSECGRKDCINDTIGNGTSDLPACSEVPR